MNNLCGPKASHRPLTANRQAAQSELPLILFTARICVCNIMLQEVRRGPLFHLLFILVFVSAEERNILNCGQTDVVDPLAEADVLVVGSGVGGTGFLRRFTSPSVQPNSTVLWFEKGHESFVAKNWPDDLSKRLTVLSPIPRKKMDWQPGLAWNAFGGGDACNSGGPNYVGIDQSNSPPYEPVDVWALRNYSITPPTNNTLLWLNAFLDSGYVGVCPMKNRSDLTATVGQVSSMRTADGRDRQVLSYPLRYSDQNNITFVHAKILRVLHDGYGRAIGVEGVRLDQDQREYGGIVKWKANKAVVLAGGVLNTFNLLINSGIGPKDMLLERQVKDVWVENEYVGQNVGDEMTAILLHVEPEKMDYFGSQPRMAASTAVVNGTSRGRVSLTYWGSGFQFWLVNENLVNKIIFGLLKNFMPLTRKLTQRIMKSISFWGIGIESKPVITLKAIKIPTNQTKKGRRDMKTNPLGIIMDDSKLQVTQDMCERIRESLKPLQKGLEKQSEAFKGKKTLRFSRFILAAVSRLRLIYLVKPHPLTKQNIESFVSNDKICNIDWFGSYYHFYGGAGPMVVNERFRVHNTTNLYISDASILTQVAAGGTSTLVMEQGMRVADAVHADFQDLETTQNLHLSMLSPT